MSVGAQTVPAPDPEFCAICTIWIRPAWSTYVEDRTGAVDCMACGRAEIIRRSGIRFVAGRRIAR